MGEYVDSLSDIQNTLHEIRNVLDEIPILASEKWLFDEARGAG
jgi:coatomer subunit beta